MFIQKHITGGAKIMKKTVFVFILLIWVMPLWAQEVDTAWVRIYNGPADSVDVCRDMAIDTLGNVYVTGYSYDYGTAQDCMTIKYYPNGDTAWARRYIGPTNDWDDPHGIAVDNAGNVYVTGGSSDSATIYDYFTIKYNSDGDTVWMRRYNGPGNSVDNAFGLAVDNLGNACVTGRSVGSGTNYDYATIKYQPDGDTAWIRRYNGPYVTSVDNARAIAVDGSGNIYVTGESEGSGGTNDDYATIKYYSNGDTAWVRRYDGPDSGWGVAEAIAVDESGNVYVTGRSEGATTDDDFCTIKYDSLGNELWVRRYNGPGNYLDNPYALAVDDSGNVCVTGFSYISPTHSDYLTIKYYPDGDTAWLRNYNGPGNQSDRARAIAVDLLGNVYVTGYSWSGMNYDFVTIKYDSDGNELWINRYNGPENGDDFGRDIDVDGFSNVYVIGGASSGGGGDFVTIKYTYLQRDDTLIFAGYSPVDIIVTDPILRSIGVDFNLIPFATYDTTQDVNLDGDNDDVVIIPKPLIGEYTVRVVEEPGSGGGTYTLAVKLNGNEDTPLADAVLAPGPAEVDTFYYPVFEYLRGDANTDGSISISDVIFLINYLFKGGPPPDPLLLGDANCCKEGERNCEEINISVSDVVYLINYLFKGGTAPCS